MRMTARVSEIVGLNTTNHYIPLVLAGGKILPMYYARMIGESTLAFPVTGSASIDDGPATALVADREGGYEAYLLEGIACYVTSDEDYDLVSEMQNLVPGFPIHGGVVFEVRNVHLVPPP
ncbi:MAG: hypothetical protein ACYC2Y_04645 [Armatimonadota bacterium]